MRVRSIHAGLAVVLLVVCSGPEAEFRVAANPQENREEAAIRAVLVEQQKAWNQGDVGTFMKGYWNSSELSFASSTGFVRGWEKVTTRYQHSYPDAASMGKLDFSDLEIRTLGAEAALVIGKWHLERSMGDVGGIFSLVFQKFPEGWRIVHDHTSVVANPPPGR